MISPPLLIILWSFKKFSTLFTSISYNSAKNIARRESIQSILKSSSFKMKEDFHIRWLSFEGAVVAVIYEDISLTSIYFLRGGLLNLLTPKTSLLLQVSLMCPGVLKQLFFLFKQYKGSYWDFSANPLLYSTVSVLESLKDSKDYIVLCSFLQQTPSSPYVDSSGLCTFDSKAESLGCLRSLFQV